MLLDDLRQLSDAAALEAWDGAAIVGGKIDRGEPTLEIAPPKIRAVCRFLKDGRKFIRLSSVTAVDRYPAEPRFEIVYHLHSVENNSRLRLKCRVDGSSPEIDSVVPVWRSADWYEREVFDLFGVRFSGHPDLRRIMLPDGWDGHPLRRDYSVTGSRV